MKSRSGLFHFLFLLPLFFVPFQARALELTECKGPLEPSLAGGCGAIDKTGCCDLYGRNLYCKNGNLYCVDCADGFEHCGWNSYGYYDCGQKEGAEDPMGMHPLACGGGCDPSCHVDSPCSAACPGSCGHCEGKGICMEDGSCYVPQCDGKECGKDPLGFSCGSCTNGKECIEALGKCMPLPTGCVAKGSPGCGGCGCEGCVCKKFPSCCTENWDILCIAACEIDCGYDCSPCPVNPSCEGLECGEYCGVSCGKCPGGEVCYQYQCCVPDCAGKECGSDGCGGSCGSCSGTDECVDGACVSCQPKCEGKNCGSDGCGGVCGQCTGADKCIEGVCQSKTCAGSCGGESPFDCWCDNQCLEFGDCCPDVCAVCPDICGECSGIGPEGCCDGQTLRRCKDGELEVVDCAQVGPSCGWNGPKGYYDCKTSGQADPSGTFPMDCSAVCFSDCSGKACGDDGCGGSCGVCGKGEVCTGEGKCCAPSCAGKTCGDDGCGGSCGKCDEALRCDGSVCVEGVPAGCVPSDAPGCGGCGCEDCVIAHDDYCETDSWDAICATLCDTRCGADCPCIPNCDDKHCGDDGCGGSCGECSEGTWCTPAGKCSDECISSCTGKECGDDGCGESCGECAPDHLCFEGLCQPACDGIPWEGCCDGEALKYCGEEGWLVTQDCSGNPGCGWKAEGYYDCGTAGEEDPAGAFPLSCEGYCEPKCSGKTCGPDGCGGSGGEWGVDVACVKGLWVVSQWGGLPYEGCCAPNDTLWWCEDAKLKKLSCAGKGPCGWNGADGYYNCATDGGADPTGTFPRECPPGIGCQPDCDGKVCGDDGCGESCGACDAGLLCQDGSCVPEGSVVEPDAGLPDATAEDVQGNEPPVKTKGGCSSTTAPSPVAAWMLSTLLLALMAARIARGRRVRMLATLSLRRCALLSLPLLALLLTGCPNEGTSPYVPPDVPKADLGADVPETPDVPGLPDAPGDLADLSGDLELDMEPGELKPPPDVPEPEEIDAADVETDTGPGFNCHSVSDGPFKLQKMPGVIASEDLAFDGKGYLTGSNNQAIFKSDPQGNSFIFSPNLKFRAGLAYLPNGWLAVNDNNMGRLVKVDPDGVQYTLLSGLKYPNGIAVDLEGYAYVTEHDANRVLRVHTYDGQYTVLTEEIMNPNGIAFNTDYSGIFIGTFGGGWVYYLSISPSGQPGQLIQWGDMTDTPGLLDGIAVDVCGNVYVCEYGATEIFRFSPDGQERVKVVDATDLGTYLPNLRFGVGEGWSNTSLYSPDGWKPEDGVWRIDIGVPSPKLPFP